MTALIETAEALVFDCDGTLVESGKLYARAWAAGFSSVGHEMSLAWYRRRAGLSERELIRAFEEGTGTRIGDPEAVVGTVRQSYVAGLAHLSEVAEVADIARRFHRKMRLAVASGGPRLLVEASLVQLGLAQLFDVVVTREDAVNPKPAPDIFFEAIRRLGLPAARCVAFEDSPEGLEAAAAAGLSVIDVARLRKG